MDQIIVNGPGRWLQSKPGQPFETDTAAAAAAVAAPAVEVPVCHTASDTERGSYTMPS